MGGGGGGNNPAGRGKKRNGKERAQTARELIV